MSITGYLIGLFDKLFKFIDGDLKPNLRNVPVLFAFPLYLWYQALRGLGILLFMSTTISYCILGPLWIPIVGILDDSWGWWQWLLVTVYCLPGYIFFIAWAYEKYIEWYRETYYDS